MRKIAFYTLGCKVNQYETELIREQFLQSKYKIVPFSQKADIYLINTCTVTAKSDRKSRYYIQNALRKDPKAKVIVTGCYVNRAQEDLAKISPRILTIPNEEKNNIINRLIQDSVYSQISTINNFEGHSRAFVKIQDGCDNYCSYCIVPYVRNVLFSRPKEEILREVTNLTQNGCREIVLTGIRLGKYKIQDEINFVSLIKLIHKIKDLKRIRLSSIEPMDITDELIDLFGSLPKLCHHLHIPLQSGDDEILKEMNRKYTTKTYKTLIDKIREKAPDINITTDVIVGFPSETEKNFNNTYEFIKNIGFGKLHVFKFSSREGTTASKLKNQIDNKTKDKRSKKLLSLSKQLTKEFYARFIGKNVEVLIEGKAKKKNYLTGITSQYIRVLINKNKQSPKDIVKVNIRKVDNEFAYTEA